MRHASRFGSAVHAASPINLSGQATLHTPEIWRYVQTRLQALSAWRRASPGVRPTEWATSREPFAPLTGGHP